MAINLMNVRKPLPGNEKKVKKTVYNACLSQKRPV
jgi:hypothetical protein